MKFKNTIFEGTSKKDIRGFPDDVKMQVGAEIMAVQHGQDPADWKPMSDIGKGVREIRIHTGNEYRIIYIAKFEEAVYVLHAFVKKSERTSQQDINIAKQRLADVVKRRAKKEA